MPVKACSAGGRPGFKWGDQGKCYTYPKGNTTEAKRAKGKAEKQGRAIEVSKHGKK